jgi:hypothetical protein
MRFVLKPRGDHFAILDRSLDIDAAYVRPMQDGSGAPPFLVEQTEVRELVSCLR